MTARRYIYRRSRAEIARTIRLAMKRREERQRAAAAATNTNEAAN
ncbi:hypothetical protein AAIG28_02235 [Citrobacter freundii]|nr:MULTISPECIES: hypothetical protein [Enterobacteriaceae]MDL4385314.1 hypothetical protein [Citrobacter braakii]MDM3108853.1 hypothetical protein [Citrobacter sp. Cf132]MDM3322072.1 hypothetical protein [Citrobacter sp. Cb080]MDU4234875.1 hypothetical protein [Citrobacter freundii]MDV1744227.1 hypothetical protein [Citrobacter freundii]